MRRTLLTTLCLVLCVTLAVSLAEARKVENNKVYHHMRAQDATESPSALDGLHATAAVSTTFLGSWTFDSSQGCVDQGWVTTDLTEQTGDYWHVDDFSGLNGGTFGRLVALEGSQSMWCGARPDAGSQILCGYASLPGYGNGWDQIFESKCFTGVTGDVTATYLASWDSEPNYDFTYLEYDHCDNNWEQLRSYTGTAFDSLETVTLADTLAGSSLRLRFHFAADGGYSDADGFYDSDGGFVLDSLTVADGNGQMSFENFESEAVGAHQTVSGDWSSNNDPGYGDFAALYPGVEVLQEDQCSINLSCVWGFFNGSTATYACAGFPGQTAVPYENSRGQYITNEIWSPVVPWTGTGSEVQLRFRVYRDLPLDPLIFYVYHVRSFVAGCPGGWRDDNTVYYGPDKDWLTAVYSIGDKILPGASDVQVAIGCWDMCPFWCGIYGTGACHSHSPLIDNVRLWRIATNGPQWDVQPWRLFQDNFATDGTITGTVRIDQANDIKPGNDPDILPGDSLAVTVNDPGNGIEVDPYTNYGPAIYGYVSVHPQNQPGKGGSALTQDPSRWPVVDSTTSPAGDKWYLVRLDSSYTASGSVVANVYCLDLNDNLFTPGDTINYFISASSNNAEHSTTYFDGGLNILDNIDASGAIVTTTDINVAFANAMEVTCLPTVQNSGGDILYVDDGDGRGVQPFFDSAFDQLGLTGKVDRYDTRASSSGVGNGPGSRVTDVFQQIIPIYKKIIWNSAELDAGTIGDGGTTVKSPDFTLLYTFLDQSGNTPGLFVSGDGVAEEWASLATADALNLKGVYMNFNLVTPDQKTLGLGITPLGIGTSGGMFDHVTGPDTLVAYGGCPAINKFDVLSPGGGNSTVEMAYDGNPAYGAVLSQTTPNNGGSTARVVLAGFSYDDIRDDRPGSNGGVADRVQFLYDVIRFLQNNPQAPVGSPTSKLSNSLTQNYPNPFNPQTTIRFSLAERAPVTLKVYNVAGQLVKTLVNGVQTAGVTHAVTWDGRNDAGQTVSSGVYFYRLVTKNYTQTRKMVLLK